jgi:hypothetical protein
MVSPGVLSGLKVLATLFKLSCIECPTEACSGLGEGDNEEEGELLMLLETERDGLEEIEELGEMLLDGLLDIELDGLLAILFINYLRLGVFGVCYFIYFF